MRWFGTSLLGLLLFAAACGANPSASPRTAAAAEPAGTQARSPNAAGERAPVATAGGDAATAPGPVPTDAMHRADALYRDQLATQGRDPRFSTDRQIAALERAILLYQQFLERAGDDPHYAEAAKRSRERIEDAKATLSFLRQGP